jgi:hypothetical protein
LPRKDGAARQRGTILANAGTVWRCPQDRENIMETANRLVHAVGAAVLIATVAAPATSPAAAGDAPTVEGVMGGTAEATAALARTRTNSRRSTF